HAALLALGRDLALRDQALHHGPERGGVGRERGRDLLAALAGVAAHVAQQRVGEILDLALRATRAHDLAAAVTAADQVRQGRARVAERPLRAAVIHLGERLVDRLQRRAHVAQHRVGLGLLLGLARADRGDLRFELGDPLVEAAALAALGGFL